MPTRIFVVDSSPAVRRIVEQISTPEGFEVVGFQDGPAALEAAKRMSPQLIIADYHLDNMTFSGFCKEVNKLDNLSETFIVSLINSSDRPDEQHLRTLGVKAFLKKPFQSEHLLDVIKSLETNGHQAGMNGASGMRRNWPPESAATDTEELEMEPTTAEDDNLAGEQEEGSSTEQPAPAPAFSITPSASEAGEAAGNEGQASEVAELLPDVVSRAPAALSSEHMATLLHDFVHQELPVVLNQEIAQQEPAVRHLVEEMVTLQVQSIVAPLVRELVESSVRKQLAEVVREQLGAIELLVKDEIQRAASTHAHEVAEHTVREVAQEKIAQAVKQLVPEIAETQIKEEIKRLSSDTPSA